MEHIKLERSASDRAAYKMAASAALRGGMKGPYWFELGYEPWCDNPVPIFRSAHAAGPEPPVEGSGKVPCRKCAKCRTYRQLRWRDRALFEVVLAKRTWFLTLTFSPVHMAGIMAEARSGGADPSPRLIERAAYAHVQRYFKRLRSCAPLSRFRYLAVFERGKRTGRAHYHALLHEVGDRPLTKRVIEANWRSHTHARLVRSAGQRQAVYMTKYLTKEVSSRPRASRGYGLARPIGDGREVTKTPVRKELGNSISKP